MPPKLNAEIINAAIEGFESQKRKIDFQIADLRQMLDGHNTDAADATSEAAPRKRKHFSAASRKKMALAQKARWAKIKGESEPPAATPAAPKRKRRKMSGTSLPLRSRMRSINSSRHKYASFGPGSTN